MYEVMEFIQAALSRLGGFIVWFLKDGKRFKFYLPEANKTASFQLNCFDTLFTANETVSYDGR